MTQEQKAKAYDEAIEKLRSLHDNYDTVSTLIDIKEEIEHIFPELRESDDEGIREHLEQEIQQHIKDCLDIKFPTTDVKMIAKDVEYTARMFFELGLKAQKGDRL